MRHFLFPEFGDISKRSTPRYWCGGQNNLLFNYFYQLMLNQMNPKFSTYSIILKVALVASLLSSGASSFGQDSDKNPVSGKSVVSGKGVLSAGQFPTDLDRPEIYFEKGKPWLGDPKMRQRIAKVDLDGDLNYDGEISNYDPSDGGDNESTPPGLQVAVGEMTKVVIRFKSYSTVGYSGTVPMELEVRGINRNNPTGEFGSQSEESNSVAHVRVWKDAGKTELLLDSRVDSKKRFRWTATAEEAAENRPGTFPRTVYVEGVSVSPNYSGDIRLLVSVAPEKGNEAKRNGRSFIYVTAFDHLLFSVVGTPVRKEFVNNNAEAVWVD